MRPAAPGAARQRPAGRRRDALREIDRVLDAAEGGYGFLAMVGEPGAGKSRLLNELADAAGARKLPCVAGRAAEFEQEMPFGAVVDALDDHLEDQTLHLSQGALRLLGTVFPALADITGEPPAASRSPGRRATSCTGPSGTCWRTWPSRPGWC